MNFRVSYLDMVSQRRRICACGSIDANCYMLTFSTASHPFSFLHNTPMRLSKNACLTARVLRSFARWIH